jgi:hypothetical protein
MPLASWFNLHFYGENSMAAVMVANSSLIAQLEAEARAEADLQALASLIATLQPGRYMAADLEAVATLAATMEPQIRMRSRLDVAARPSAEDIAQATLNAFLVENGLSVSDILRVLLAVSAGKLAGAAGTTVTIRDTADTKNRVTATVDADGNRTAVTLDPN